MTAESAQLVNLKCNGLTCTGGLVEKIKKNVGWTSGGITASDDWNVAERSIEERKMGGSVPVDGNSLDERSVKERSVLVKRPSGGCSAFSCKDVGEN